MPLTPQQQFLIDFKLDQVPATLGLNVSDSAAALLLGLNQADFNVEVAKVCAEVEEAAQALLKEAEVAEAVAAWTLARKTTLLFLGDSITAMRRSYAEILNAMLKQARPEVQLDFINLAQSGFTSGNGLQDTYTVYLSKQPDCAFIFFGANDSTHVEGIQGRTLVSLDEYKDNLRQIVAAFQQHTRARVVLFTPTPVVESAANAAYNAMRLFYSNDTAAKFADATRALAKSESVLCLDLWMHFGSPPEAKQFGADGLHPNLEGQKEIVRYLLKTIS
jgi:lysophospholipase L1-like esterase